jgi:predicted PurR-regulated permease PerM
MDDPAGSPPGIPIEGQPEAGHSTSPPPGSPSNRRLRPPTPRVALVLVGAAVVLITLYLGREALTPFIVGLLIVYLLAPPVERLHRVGLPRPVSILVVYLIATFVLIEAVNLTLRPVVEQITSLFRDLPRLAAQLDGQLQQLSEVYRGLNLPPQIRASIDEWLATIAGGDIGFDPGVLLPVVNLTAGFVSSLFGYLIIPVWAFYLLKDRRGLVAGFDHALPAEWRTDVWSVIRITERVLAQWIRGQVFLGVTVGVATFGGLIILSLVVDPVFGRFALLLALVAGLLELLPIIGPIIAAVPAVLLAATAGPQAVVAALALYVLVQQVENNLLVPKILIGEILALPITAAARDVFAYLFRRLNTDSGGLGGGLAAATTVNQARSLPLSPFLVNVDALHDPQAGSEADQRSAAVTDKGQGDPRDRHDPDHHAEVHDQVEEDHRGQT